LVCFGNTLIEFYPGLKTISSSIADWKLITKVDNA
jgi:hypothetical protein